MTHPEEPSARWQVRREVKYVIYTQGASPKNTASFLGKTLKMFLPSDSSSLSEFARREGLSDSDLANLFKNPLEEDIPHLILLLKSINLNCEIREETEEPFHKVKYAIDARGAPPRAKAGLLGQALKDAVASHPMSLSEFACREGLADSDLANLFDDPLEEDIPRLSLLLKAINPNCEIRVEESEEP